MRLSSDLRLTELFEVFFKVEVMENPSAGSCEKYYYALDLWREITGDPPLHLITSGTMAAFKVGLRKLCVGKSTRPLAVNTVRGYLDHVQWILDQAGPPQQTRRLRTALGLIDRVPWTKPPRRQNNKKLPTPIEHIVAFYAVALQATYPEIAGITAPAWWRALTSVECCTSLRIGQLMRTPASAVNWNQHYILLPAYCCRKSNAEEMHPLHPIAFRDLIALRGDRELLFGGWADAYARRQTYDELHRLQSLAGVPSFGFHGMRRRALTEIGKISLTAATLAAGHASSATTINHYIGVEALAATIEHLDLMNRLG